MEKVILQSVTIAGQMATVSFRVNAGLKDVYAFAETVPFSGRSHDELVSAAMLQLRNTLQKFGEVAEHIHEE